MVSLTADPMTTITAVLVVALAAALALMALEYRGEPIGAWLRRSASVMTIGAGLALAALASILVVATFVHPPLIAATASVVIVLAAGLAGLALVYRQEIPLHRPARAGAAERSASRRSGDLPR